MAVSVVGYASTAGSTTSLTVNRSAVDAALGGTVTDGDLLVGVLTADFAATSGMVASTGSWTQHLFQISAGGSDAGSNVKVKVFLHTAASEPTSWSFGQGSGSDGVLTVVALRGGDNTPANVIAAIQSTGAAGATSQVTPTVDHAGIAGSMMLAGASIDSSGGTNTWTPPGDMTEIADSQSATFTSHTVATLASPADPTGTKTFTCTSTSHSAPGVQWALVVAAGNPPVVDNLRLPAQIVRVP